MLKKPANWAESRSNVAQENVVDDSEESAGLRISCHAEATRKEEGHVAPALYGGHQLRAGGALGVGRLELEGVVDQQRATWQPGAVGVVGREVDKGRERLDDAIHVGGRRRISNVNVNQAVSQMFAIPQSACALEYTCLAPPFMTLLPLAIGFIGLLSIFSEVLGAPQWDTSTAGQSLPLTRRTQPSRNASELADYAKNLRDATIAKYSLQRNKKRGTGKNLVLISSGFYGILAVGTPPYPFAVILDTGSSVTYGSGEAAGTLGQDIVQMAGFTIPDQAFAVATSTSLNFLQNPVTGIFGLAWQSLASSGAMPFWQALASQSQWSQPLMAFQLTRPSWRTRTWGIFDNRYPNESLYTGAIDYRDIPDGQASFWLQQITCGSASYAAIDTGTTLVAGPAAGIAAIYAQIPGSQPGTGRWEGFYSYPCDTAVAVEISFGGPNWSVSPDDFEFTSTGNECYGAFYAIATYVGTPSWIIGDTFLKNVYSVFRYNPPSVGFAALSKIALAMNGKVGGIPSATLGANSAKFTLASSAAPSTRSSSAVALVISALFATFVSFTQG
ncbi:aspartic peptidase domain-containing protein [Suillus paluster]|uniref:aspartic peptidase domain-containing protein n=1 Tax=Suillus paluster TaxID=48578 RepID=UPI001B85F5EB|nr:aspartic peptidase domain-containing protein [Suillus paluster]KAG1728182.1 aspartic peptidase domain-containing protein [Suillus paluster]